MKGVPIISLLPLCNRPRKETVATRMQSIPDLAYWKEWMAAFPAQAGPPMTPGSDDVANTEYQEPIDFKLGMALQTADHRVRFYSRLPDGFSVVDRGIPGDEVYGPLHRHDVLELGYVVSGRARQVFSGKEYCFHAGDFWITDYQCQHRDLYFPEDLFTLWICMPRDLFDAVFFDSVGQSPLRQFLYTALLRQKERFQFLRFARRIEDGVTTGILAQLVTELHRLDTGSEYIIRGFLTRLLSRLSLGFDCLVEEQERAHMHQLLYNEVEAFIHTHLATVTIRMLTERFHYSDDFYNRLIHRYGGTTYSELLQRIRLEEAESLLCSTSLPIDEIVERVGYQSKGFFYQLFSRQHGMPPGEYRKKKGVSSGGAHSNTRPEKTNESGNGV